MRDYQGGREIIKVGGVRGGSVIAGAEVSLYNGVVFFVRGIGGSSERVRYGGGRNYAVGSAFLPRKR